MARLPEAALADARERFEGSGWDVELGVKGLEAFLDLLRRHNYRSELVADRLEVHVAVLHSLGCTIARLKSPK